MFLKSSQGFKVLCLAYYPDRITKSSSTFGSITLAATLLGTSEWATPSGVDQHLP